MGTTERYARHIALKEIGEEGQKKINHAQVLVIGAGGLGSPVLLYLAAAGVGTIGIMDDDCVSESNLQRQILYDTQCLGEPKAAAAARKLSALNPGCTLHPMPFRLTRENAQATIAQYDIVVDATDNLETRYLINDACVTCGKPFVYGSICEFTGQVSVFNYQGGAASTTSANPWGSLEHYRESSAPSRLPKPSKSSWEAPTPCLAGYCSSTSSKALSVPCKSPPWKGEALHIAKCTHEHGRTIQYNHIQSHEKKEEIQMLIPSHCTERVKTMPQP